jgi:hypothetical protein
MARGFAGTSSRRRPGSLHNNEAKIQPQKKTRPCGGFSLRPLSPAQYNATQAASSRDDTELLNVGARFHPKHQPRSSTSPGTGVLVRILIPHPPLAGDRSELLVDPCLPNRRVSESAAMPSFPQANVPGFDLRALPRQPLLCSC